MRSRSKVKKCGKFGRRITIGLHQFQGLSRSGELTLKVALSNCKCPVFVGFSVCAIQALGSLFITPSASQKYTSTLKFFFLCSRFAGSSCSLAYDATRSAARRFCRSEKHAFRDNLRLQNCRRSVRLANV